MALCLRARLVGRAQNAIKSLSEAEKADYDRVKAKLMEQFEPGSKCALYKADFNHDRNDQEKIGPLLAKR